MDMSGTRTCIVCGQPKDEGITIVTEFLCSACGSDIVRTDVGDEKYAHYVRQLRQITVRVEG